MKLCKNCGSEIAEDNKGIEIYNYFTEDYPPELLLCKNCSEEIAVNLISGRLPNLSVIGSFLKGAFKK